MKAAGRRVPIMEQEAGIDQQGVTAYFQADAPFWDTLYERRDVFAVIHQHRQMAALRLVDGLGLTAGTPMLEVGCGAGHFSMALAGRGYDITATDSASAMVETTRRHAAEGGLERRVAATVADAQAMPFADESFALVVALGVIPWLPSPQRALHEMARVLRPGGVLVVNVDNVRRLNHLVDPLLSPVLAPVRRWRRGLARRTAPAAATVRTSMHRCGEFDAMLESAGLLLVTGQTFGFGPFSFMGRRVVSERVGVWLHRSLQRLADQGIPVIRATGAQYLVLAAKPATR